MQRPIPSPEILRPARVARLQVWSQQNTYVNHHEVVNLLVNLPEVGPMRDSIHSIMKVCAPPMHSESLFGMTQLAAIYFSCLNE